jgi:uncharacterized SAM-binding protein YcdF (DUF218 family)
MTDRSEPAALVVLGARLRPDGAPGPALARRIAHALALNARTAPALVVASGGPAGAAPTEAAVIAAALRAAGVPAAAILEEDRSRDTVENARFTAALLRARGIGRVVIVSDRRHLPRAVLAFRLLGLAATGSGPPAGPGLGPAGRALAVAREAAALPPSLLRALAWRLRGS